MGIFTLAAIIVSIVALYKSRNALHRIEDLERQVERLRKTGGQVAPQTVPRPPEPAPRTEEKRLTPAQSEPPAVRVQAPIVSAQPPAVHSEPAVDWEKFTGVRLFAWLGGLALFLGAAFFVKYSIDHELISPILRVALGFLLGIGLIAGGIVMRPRGYAYTVQTLCAAGIAILYADVFAAHTYYHFIGMNITFLLMTLVTAAGFLLSVRLDAQYVAILALIGGFLTPPILSSGVDRPVGLFGYIALLNIGLAATAIHRRWGFLTGLAALGTLIIEFGWVHKFFVFEKCPIAVCVFTGFSLFFMAVLKIAERRGFENRWVFTAGAAMPIISMGFTAYLLQFPELGARPGLVLTYLALLDMAVGFVAWGRADFGKIHAVAGVVGFMVLLFWTLNYLTPGLLPWGLSFFFVFAAIHSILPVLLARRHPAEKTLPLGHFYPLLMLVLTMVPMMKEIAVPQIAWVFVLLINAVAFATVLLAQAIWAGVLTIAMTFMLFGMLIGKETVLPHAGEFVLFLAFFSLLFFSAAVFLKIKLKKEPAADSVSPMHSFLVAHLPAAAIVLPYLLLSAAVSRLPLADPSPVFGLGLILSILVIGLVRYQRADAAGCAGLVSTVMLLVSWHWEHFDRAQPAPALFWYTIFFVVWAGFPFLFLRKFSERKIPWAAAAFAGPAIFYLFHKVVSKSFGTEFIGLLPAAFALIYLGGLMILIRKTEPDNPVRMTQLSLFAGVGLFFISLIFPLQFEKEWITIGWAVEAMALVWLYRKIPHEGLKIWSAGLFAISFVRLALNPAVLEYHARADQPIFNWYLYAYGTVIACFLISARWLKPPRDIVLGKSAPPIFYALAGILGFLLLNIEIADYFSTGATLTFQFRGSLARDMCYSIGWALYGLGILLLGIRFKSRGARFAALGMIVVTVIKVFIHDLWRLGQLYRVASFIGLAVILILVSFLYQRLQAKEEK